jgi:1-acyl-sn-glycerol-3-phosphate acyltransferase
MRSLPRLLAAGARLFYRLDVQGRAPADGPVLFVANHPNSLLDPALVAVAAGREVRFLAKHTLFGDRKVGWLVRASGAVPVYRQQDGPAPAGGNDAMFAAARAVLAAGGAVGVFGEGVSHAEPRLQPLKTGPARLALGTARELGRPPAVVPVGITLADRAVFRSAALVVVGPPVAWDDLAGRGDGDAEAVRALTARIGAGLRDVTANFATWDDARLVAFAEAVHAAEAGAGAASAGTPIGAPAGARLARWQAGAGALERLRAAGDPAWAPLAADLAGHERLLAALRLAPARPARAHGPGHRARLGAAPGAPAPGRRARGARHRAGVARLPPGAADRAPRAPTRTRRTCRPPPSSSSARSCSSRGRWRWRSPRGWRPGRPLGGRGGLLAAAAALVGAPALAVHTLRTAEGWRAAWRDAGRFLRPPRPPRAAWRSCARGSGRWPSAWRRRSGRRRPPTARGATRPRRRRRRPGRVPRGRGRARSRRGRHAWPPATASAAAVA